MEINEFYTLSNGIQIPNIGFGTWQIDNDIASRCVLDALDSGYIHIDTAIAYGNEVGVGEAVKASNIKREDIFITSKIPAEIKTYEDAKRCIDESLKRLDVSYIDLMLIHAPRPWSLMGPNPTYRYFKENIEVYKALEEAYLEGKLKSIGVSNFDKDDIENIFSNCKIKPHVNQICVFIGNTPFDLIRYCKEQNILVEAYSPLGTGKLLKNEKAKIIADKYNVSIAQLGIRYCLQIGTLPLPKSVSKSHIEENKNVDFIISGEDMDILKKI